MSSPITLYDLASRGDSKRCWSFNVWKTRLAMNYKGISYTVTWVDNNTLAPTLASIGAPRNTDGRGFEYTVPTIKIPSTGALITDSAVIAEKLEELYPDTPSLRLDPELQSEAYKVTFQALAPLFPIYMFRLARDVVPESAVERFIRDHEKLVGMTMEEAERVSGDGSAWIAAQPGFDALKAFLKDKKRNDGPFVLGGQVCYADFIVVAILEALRTTGEDVFERAVGLDESFGRLYDACKQWT